MQHTRTIRYSLTTAMALAAIVASTAPAALAAPATRPATATAVAGYIWSDDGAATPDSYYAYNSTGGSVTQTSPASGEYEIDFGGLGSIASTSVVQVTTYDDEFNCDVAGWGPSSGAGTDLLASVSCYTLAGTLATTGDIVFDLVVTHAVSPPHGVFDYSFVNKDNSSGNLVAYQYNSSRKKNSVKHLSKGHYQVTLAGPSSKGTTGIVKVSAYGNEPGSCELEGWTGSAKGELVNVDCYTLHHVAQNREFIVTYATANSLLGINGQTVANAFANGSSALYQPKVQYDSHKSARVSVVHYSTGEYGVLPVGSDGDFDHWGGDVQISAVDSKGRLCVSDGWDQELTPSITVDCYDAKGDLVDSPFTVEWVVP
jgi:hypothetical protein